MGLDAAWAARAATSTWRRTHASTEPDTKRSARRQQGQLPPVNHDFLKRSTKPHTLSRKPRQGRHKPRSNLRTHSQTVHSTPRLVRSGPNYNRRKRQPRPGRRHHSTLTPLQTQSAEQESVRSLINDLPPDFSTSHSPMTGVLNRRGRVSPRFADYESEHGRVNGMFQRPKGRHEWADMTLFMDKQSDQTILQEKQTRVKRQNSFQRALEAQLSEQRKIRQALEAEKKVERQRVHADVDAWKREERAKEERKFEELRRNRDVVIQQRSIARREKEVRRLRTKEIERDQARKLQQQLKHEAEEQQQRKRDAAERIRKVVAENKRTKDLRSAQLEQERLKEERELRRHAERKQKIEDERRVAAEAHRLKMLERETIALARNKGLDEKAKEDEIRAERARIEKEKQHAQVLRLRDEQRRSLVEDIRRENVRLLETKRAQKKREQQEAAALASKLQFDYERAVSAERRKRDELRQRHQLHAEALRKQIAEDERRRRAHPEAMTSVERQLNAALLRQAAVH